jgi:hypothetical protein
MGKRIGPVKIKNYGVEFKLRAVQLSSQPGVLVKDVAERPVVGRAARLHGHQADISIGNPALELVRLSRCFSVTRQEPSATAS